MVPNTSFEGFKESVKEFQQYHDRIVDISSGRKISETPLVKTLDVFLTLIKSIVDDEFSVKWFCDQLFKVILLN